MNIIEQLKQKFNSYLTKTFSLTNDQLKNCQFQLNVDPAKQQVGDINSNAAMVLAKEFKKNPREVAQTIADGFSDPLIEKIEIAGPGFLNLYFTKAAIHQMA